MDHLQNTESQNKSRVAGIYLAYQRRFLDLFLKRHASRLSPQEIRRGRVLVALLIFGALAASAMAAVRFMTEGLSVTPVVVSLGVLAILWGLVHFVRTGNNTASGDLLIITVLGIIFMTAFYDNGLHSRVLTWLPALPLVANFTAARLTAVRTSLLVLIGLLTLLAGHELQWIDTVYLDDSLGGRLAASFGSMLFVSAIAYAYEDSRRQADEDREAFSRARNDWVSMVSHELRTPLTSLYGGLKLVASGQLDDQPDKQAMLLSISTRNTERLVHLVNDILDIERLSSGQIKLDLKPIDLSDVIKEAVNTQQYCADEHGVVLTTRLEHLPAFNADSDRLLQVVQNLLSNAIKFSHPGDEVQVSLGESERGVVCEVRDQGSGVSASFRGKLFERFAQQESGTQRRSGGSGLGLFICRGLIELHGGQIGYRPRAKGGSVFYFELPGQ